MPAVKIKFLLRNLAQIDSSKLKHTYELIEQQNLFLDSNIKHLGDEQEDVYARVIKFVRERYKWLKFSLISQTSLNSYYSNVWPALGVKFDAIPGAANPRNQLEAFIGKYILIIRRLSTLKYH